MIRDEVVLAEILEEAGRLLVERELASGPIEKLRGFAWVTVSNVAKSRLRRGPMRLQQATLDSAESEAALLQLPATRGSPDVIERRVMMKEIPGACRPRNAKSTPGKRRGSRARKSRGIEESPPRRSTRCFTARSRRRGHDAGASARPVTQERRWRHMTSDDSTNGYDPENKPMQPMRADAPDDDANGADDVLDEVFARANPNPGRVGCPPRNVLRELALRQRPIEDPGYLHLSECSPCWVEFRAAQKAAATAVPPQMSAFKKMAAAAAVFLLVGAGAWFFCVGPRRRGPNPEIRLRLRRGLPTVVAVTIDLRPYEIQRSEQNQPAQPPVLLPRDRVRATILLPVGSEPGTVELQVLDADRQSGRRPQALRSYETS